MKKYFLLLALTFASFSFVSLAQEFDDEDKLDLYVNSVLDRVVSGAVKLGYSPTDLNKIQILVNYADIKYANASIDENGRLLVSIHFLTHLRSEDQLAMILSHELTHYLNPDSFELKFKEGMSHHVFDIRDALDYPKMREFELLADQIGFKIHQAAGYNPYETLATYTSLKKLVHGQMSFMDKVESYVFYRSYPTFLRRRLSLLGPTVGTTFRKTNRPTPLPKAIMDAVQKLASED